MLVDQKGYMHMCVFSLHLSVCLCVSLTCLMLMYKSTEYRRVCLHPHIDSDNTQKPIHRRGATGPATVNKNTQ